MGRLGQKVKKIGATGMKIGAGVIGLGAAVGGAFGLGLKSTGDGDLGQGASVEGEFNRRVSPPAEPVGNLFSGIAEGVSGRQGEFLRQAEADFDDFDDFGAEFGSSGFGQGLRKGGRVRRKKMYK